MFFDLKQHSDWTDNINFNWEKFIYTSGFCRSFGTVVGAVEREAGVL